MNPGKYTQDKRDSSIGYANLYASKKEYDRGNHKEITLFPFFIWFDSSLVFVFHLILLVILQNVRKYFIQM